MSDLMGILSKSYSSVHTPSPGKYVNVEPEKYQGSWDGAYANKTKFKFEISNVSGFRAQVKYTSGTSIKYQQVLIKDGGFRVGDTKFQLTAEGKATIKTVETDPVTQGSTLQTAYAKKV